jgi:16S rRNA (guanine(966)-N(2))-methyltransferase RsmD
MDKMRESLFSILGNLQGSSFLDLFSGSGIIGIEAASRGAAPVMLVEGDPGKRKTILSNISFVESPIHLAIMPVERYLASSRRRFDYVFMDPPFRYTKKLSLLQRVEERALLEERGKVLIHHPKSDALPDSVGKLIRIDSRSYGGSIVDFYTTALFLEHHLCYSR